MSNKPRRKEGYIPSLSRATIPRRFFLFDTETTMPKRDDTLHKQELIVGCAIYLELDKQGNERKRIEYTFRNTVEFLECLANHLNKRGLLWAMAHNVAFDIRVLNLPYTLHKNGIKTEFPINNGQVFIWKVKTGMGSVQFVDSMNYLSSTLAQVGDDLDIPKIDIDLNNCDEDELIAYCMNDCHILEMFIYQYTAWLRDNDLGAMALTRASQAMKTFRYKFMKHDIFTSNNGKILDLERNAYFGGRTEAFYIGNPNDAPYYYLDINSAYPHAMLSEQLPTEPLLNPKPYSVRMLKILMESSYAIANVSLSNNIPVFPFKFSNNDYSAQRKQASTIHPTLQILRNRLLFPVGEPTTYLHDIELRYALEHDMIQEVHSATLYKTAPIFKEFVEYFHQEKQQAENNGNSTIRLFTKLLLNSLYGKFGQRNYHTMEILGTDQLKEEIMEIYDLDNDRHYKRYVWYGHTYMIAKWGEGLYSVPSIAGAITAIARMNLWKYMVIAGAENVFYVDTDSLMVNQTGYDNLSSYIQPDVLGMLKLEDTTNILYISGAKDYAFDGYPKSKGIPRNAIEISEGVYAYWQWEGLKTWIKRGGNTEPLIWQTTKRRQTPYSKGNVSDNGYVNPHRVLGRSVLPV
jgi:hypothetical protein